MTYYSPLWTRLDIVHRELIQIFFRELNPLIDMEYARIMLILLNFDWTWFRDEKHQYLFSIMKINVTVCGFLCTDTRWGRVASGGWRLCQFFGGILLEGIGLHKYHVINMGALNPWLWGNNVSLSEVVAIARTQNMNLEVMNTQGIRWFGVSMICMG